MGQIWVKKREVSFFSSCSEVANERVKSPKSQFQVPFFAGGQKASLTFKDLTIGN